jgi:hypothetical protein
MLKSGGEASELIMVTFKMSHIITHGAGLEVTESCDDPKQDLKLEPNPGADNYPLPGYVGQQ